MPGLSVPRTRLAPRWGLRMDGEKNNQRQHEGNEMGIKKMKRDRNVGRTRLGVSESAFGAGCVHPAVSPLTASTRDAG